MYTDDEVSYKGKLVKYLKYTMKNKKKNFKTHNRYMKCG